MDTEKSPFVEQFAGGINDIDDGEGRRGLSFTG